QRARGGALGLLGLRADPRRPLARGLAYGPHLRVRHPSGNRTVVCRDVDGHGAFWRRVVRAFVVRNQAKRRPYHFASRLPPVGLIRAPVSITATSRSQRHMSSPGATCPTRREARTTPS